jgi:hypothetical protein
MARKVWEVEAWQGHGPRCQYLFTSKARAERAVIAYLKDGNTISGPRPRNVY